MYIFDVLSGILSDIKLLTFYLINMNIYIYKYIKISMFFVEP